MIPYLFPVSLTAMSLYYVHSKYVCVYYISFYRNMQVTNCCLKKLELLQNTCATVIRNIRSYILTALYRLPSADAIRRWSIMTGTETAHSDGNYFCKTQFHTILRSKIKGRQFYSTAGRHVLFSNYKNLPDFLQNLYNFLGL